jgi:hypothetical protein
VRRRDFLSGLVGGVVAVTAVREWLFRIYSFPSDVRIGSDNAIAKIRLDSEMTPFMAPAWHHMKRHRPGLAGLRRAEQYSPPDDGEALIILTDLDNSWDKYL